MTGTSPGTPTAIEIAARRRHITHLPICGACPKYVTINGRAFCGPPEHDGVYDPIGCRCALDYLWLNPAWECPEGRWPGQDPDAVRELVAAVELTAAVPAPRPSGGMWTATRGLLTRDERRLVLLRLNTCRHCEQHEAALDRCAECGCRISLKARRPDYECKLDKWRTAGLLRRLVALRALSWRELRVNVGTWERGNVRT